VVIFRACQVAAALGLIRRLERGRRPRPPLTSPSPYAERSITAVRPARDEEGRLAGCPAPLTGDPDLAEIIVVDDESSDRTAAVGEEHGAAVLAGRALPPASADKGGRSTRGCAPLAAISCSSSTPIIFHHPVVTRPAPSTAPAAHRENP
jgi:dolichol-phosphate mannosyltransferase